MDGGGQLGLDALDAGFVPRPLVRVTPARLGTWADCPRRYRLTYVDRLPRAGARAASTLGAVVHLALRALYALPPDRRTPEAAAGLVDRHWSAEGFSGADQAAAYRVRARDWVADYAAGPGAGATPVAVEKWVSVTTPRVIAEGRADRIDERPDPDGAAELVVVDYKTGRRPTADDAARSPALALYALAARRTLHRPCRRVELHHVPTGDVAAATHDEAALRAHLARIEETAAELADATEFPARPAPRCGSCDVRRHCPEGRAAAPEAPAWAGLEP